MSCELSRRVRAAHMTPFFMSLFATVALLLSRAVVVVVASVNSSDCDTDTINVSDNASPSDLLIFSSFKPVFRLLVMAVYLFSHFLSSHMSLLQRN
jgi:hypothetical protein